MRTITLAPEVFEKIKKTRLLEFSERLEGDVTLLTGDGKYARKSVYQITDVVRRILPRGVEGELWAHTLVRRRGVVSRGASMRQSTLRDTLRALRDLGEASTPEVAGKLGIREDACRIRLYKLREMGLVWNPSPGVFAILE